ncbi:MAG TPA: helix-turn-helix transcriptional regulator [Pseudonocardiaceae bacterium]
MSGKLLQEPSFLILTALASGPKHGYGIVSDVAAISDGRVHLRAGTLYAALDRLCSEGWVEPDSEEVVDGRLRRYYRLTSQGASRLDTEVARMRSHVQVAEARLRARTPVELAGGSA